MWFKKYIIKTILSFAFFSFFGVQISKAQAKDDLSLFLTTSAYGMGAGALLGVASLAFSDDPANKLSNVAKGASLGLYAGIGLGLYYIYGGTAEEQKLESYSEKSFLIFPVFEFEKKQNEIWISKSF